MRLPDKELAGQFQGLDETGQLLLRLPDGSIQAVSSGEVFALRGSGRVTVMAPQQELVFAPLGGVGEIGMNLSIYGLGDERRRTWLAIDCGMGFAAEEHVPGVDVVLPDIRYLVEERKNLVGLVITHGHEDHIGAIIDLWPR